jgi:nitrite reductase (cytochrome c-552)
MHSFVCGQCHVEYYCGPKATLFYPWNNGLKVEQIEALYDGYKFGDGSIFYDWQHAETGGEVLKAQHPEFELWSRGIHARSGVSCADCHMPYTREGALKVSDHWVRSRLLNISRSCQVCHVYPEEEIQARVDAIQDRTHALMQRTAKALVEMLDAVSAAKETRRSRRQACALAPSSTQGAVAIGFCRGRKLDGLSCSRRGRSNSGRVDRLLEAGGNAGSNFAIVRFLAARKSLIPGR